MGFKKVLFVLIVVFFAFSVIGCSASNDAKKATTSVEKSAQKVEDKAEQISKEVKKDVEKVTK